MKLVLAGLALALALAALGASGAGAQESGDICGGDLDEASFLALPRAERIERMTCLQAAAAASIQGQLPHVVDELTRVTEVTSNGTIVTYVNAVDLTREEIPAEAIPEIISSTRSNVCEDVDMSAVIRMGGGYRHVWRVRDGSILAETTIDSC